MDNNVQTTPQWEKLIDVYIDVLPYIKYKHWSILQRYIYALDICNLQDKILILQDDNQLMLLGRESLTVLPHNSSLLDLRHYDHATSIHELVCGSSIVNVSSCTLVLLPLMLQSEDQLLHFLTLPTNTPTCTRAARTSTKVRSRRLHPRTKNLIQWYQEETDSWHMWQRILQYS